MSHPSLILIIGVSGSGKTTVLNYLIKQFPILQYVNSTTTRALRPGEIDGERYHFVSQADFQASIDAGEFLEYATVHGQNRYGTKRSDVQTIQTQGKVPIKEVDIAGLAIIQKDQQIGPSVVSVFIDIDDELMVERILKRSPLPDEEIQRRIQSAQHERQGAQELCTHIIDGSGDIPTVVQMVEDCLKPYLL